MDAIRSNLVIEAAKYADDDKSGPRSWEESFLFFLAQEGFVLAQVHTVPHKHRVMDNALTGDPVVVVR